MSDSLLQIGTQLTRIILPMIITVGVVGNSLNIAVLTRPSLYQHACSRYFLAVACNNLIYSSLFFVNRLLTNGYQINLYNYNVASCKILTYLGTISSFLASYWIVSASIDRYCSSSTNAFLRRFSSVQIARWMIFIVIIIFSLFFINILILADVQLDKGLSCAVRANSVYAQVYIITQVFLFAVVPPSLMTLFGLLTIQNSNRTVVVRVVASRYNRTENQLARMLFLQVTVHVLLTLPTSVTYLIAALPNTIRTTIIFSFINTITQLLFYCSYVTSFFLYILSGRVYKKELIQLIQRILRNQHRNRIIPFESQTVG